jgi:D-glycero-D-manno-heptose 1,7-bisphosphate phosphatase
LDRDGTVVVDRGYLHDPQGLEFKTGAAEGLRWLALHGFRLVVITNQSGVGRGMFSLSCLTAMDARLHAMTDAIGAPLERIYSCPHAPEDRCACRKPEQGLMRQAALDLNFDPRSAVVIGDKPSDVEFGRRAGANTILLRRTGSADPANGDADAVAPNLLAAARLVTGRAG